MPLIGDRHLSAAGRGPWTVDGRPWPLDFGLWTPSHTYSRPLKLIFFSALTLIKKSSCYEFSCQHFRNRSVPNLPVNSARARI